MVDTAYQKFVARWEEVIDLPPQNVGPLTPVYRLMVKRLKVMPWPAFVLLAVALVGTVSLVVGSTITGLVSLLQRGF